MKRDGCELCHGEKGGMPGNENRIRLAPLSPESERWIVVCDYCHAEMKDEENDAHKRVQVRRRDGGLAYFCTVRTAFAYAAEYPDVEKISWYWKHDGRRENIRFIRKSPEGIESPPNVWVFESMEAVLDEALQSVRERE